MNNVSCRNESEERTRELVGFFGGKLQEAQLRSIKNKTKDSQLPRKVLAFSPEGLSEKRKSDAGQCS